MLNILVLVLFSILVAIDIVLCSGVLLQLICIALGAFCLLLGCYIARKQKNGVWLSKQQYDDLHDLVRSQIVNKEI